MGSADSSLGRGVGGEGEDEEVGADAGITPGDRRQEVVSIRMARKIITNRFMVVFFHWTRHGRGRHQPTGPTKYAGLGKATELCHENVI